MVTRAERRLSWTLSGAVVGARQIHNDGVREGMQEQGMPPSKFTEDQIVDAVRQVNAGTPAVRICRTLGITQTTLSRWRKKYDGVALSGLDEVRRLREENQNLKQVVANLLFLVIAAKPNNWS